MSYSPIVISSVSRKNEFASSLFLSMEDNHDVRMCIASVVDMALGPDEDDDYDHIEPLPFMELPEKNQYIDSCAEPESESDSESDSEPRNYTCLEFMQHERYNREIEQQYMYAWLTYYAMLENYRQVFYRYNGYLPF